MLTRGGNAVDAAIAVVAAQGVVAPETCGIGGDLFALVHRPGDERPVALNASGMAGSGADATELRDAGNLQVPRSHRMSVTVPGCVDGLAALSERLGTWSLAACLEPAMTLAVQGFKASAEQARAFAATADMYRENLAVSDFYPDGEPVAEGDLVRRPDLGRTLGDIARDGRSGFYEGPAGADIVEALAPYVTEEDLAVEQFEWTEPIGRQIDGVWAWTMPPNSAGYLGPATLAVFLATDPPDDPDDPLWWHLLIEAHRSLAWERERLVADSRNAPEAASLLSDDYIGRAASAISVDRPGTWPTRPSATTDTAYMCVSDGDGMSVSIINSNYHGTGSPYGARRSGFLLHDRGAGFSLVPGHPNELAPGKRPAHTLSPTLWTLENRTAWLLGTRGGEVQPQLVAQLAARAIVNGTTLEDAQAAPRWAMTSYGVGEASSVSLEPGAERVAQALREMGHEVDQLSELQSGWGPMSIVDLTASPPRTARDPRVHTTRALVVDVG